MKPVLTLLSLAFVVDVAHPQRPCLETTPAIVVAAGVGFAAANRATATRALDDTLIAVGAARSVGPPFVVYERGPTGFSESARLELGASASDATFVSAGLGPDLAAVAFTAAANSELYTFERQLGAWVAVAAPTAPFGMPLTARSSVAVAGHDVVVADRLTGQCAVHRRLGASWTTVQVLSPWPPATQFTPHDVSLGATATRLATYEFATGRLVIFERATETSLWTQATALVVASPGAEAFGVAVAGHLAFVSLGDELVVVERFAAGASVTWQATAVLRTALLGGASPLTVSSVEFATGQGLARLHGATSGATHVGFRREPVLDQWVWDDTFDATATAGLGDDGFGFDGATLVVLTSSDAVATLDVTPVLAPEWDCDGDCQRDTFELAACAGVCDLNGNGRLDVCEVVGTRYCSPNAPHQLGYAARLDLIGSPSVRSIDLAAVGRALPPGTFAMLGASGVTAHVPGALGGPGTLCIGGATVGRYSTQIRLVDAQGHAVVPIDPSAVPSGTGTRALTPGTTWHFQYWYRAASGPSFTDAVALTFVP